MNKKNKFKKGDKIVHFGRINRIFEISKKKKDKKQNERTIYFKPYYKSKKDKSVVYSIPVKNIDKTGIRKPISKKKLKEYYQLLAKPAKATAMINISQAKRMIAGGNLKEIITVLRRLWKEKYNPETNYTKSRKAVFKNGIKRLIEEFAYVDGITRRKARRKIKKYLKKQKLEEIFPQEED